MKILANVSGNLALIPRKPGLYLDRYGSVCVLETQGTDRRWYGQISGHMTRTWWHANGRHNTYPNHDLIALVEETDQ